MGNVSVAISDEFSLFSNPGTLTKQPHSSLALFVDHRYGIKGLNSKAFACNYMKNKSFISGGVHYFGDELMNQSRMEMAFAHKIRMVSLGIGAGINQLTISEYGSARAFIFRFGGFVEITPKLFYGAHVYNLLRAKIESHSNLYYPVLMSMGFAYVPSNLFLVSAEIEKDSRFVSNAKIGLEYKMVEWLKVRTGINTSPSNGFFGIGLKFREWNFDYGISIHSRLGFVHFVGLVYGLKSQKDKNETSALK